MLKILIGISFVLISNFCSLLALSEAKSGEKDFKDLSLQGNYQGQAVTVAASLRNGGAIDSLTVNGFQYINSHDHGRELQSAISFDGNGECANPTEAGSLADGIGPHSSSNLQNISIKKNHLITTSVMALWLDPKSSRCNNRQSNNTLAILSKDVSLGYNGFDNIIHHKIHLSFRSDHKSVTVELLTAYMNPELRNFYSVDLFSNVRKVINHPDGEQMLPLIAASDDEMHALAIVALSSKEGSDVLPRYGHFSFLDYPGTNNATTKLNIVFRYISGIQPEYAYEAVTIFGTLKEVTETMTSLSHSFLLTKSGR